MLLPSTFPIAISVLPDMLAKMLTISSGAEVPNATMVKPITIDEILSFLAIEDDPSTSKSAPLISKTKPRMNKI